MLEAVNNIYKNKNIPRIISSNKKNLTLNRINTHQLPPEPIIDKTKFIPKKLKDLNLNASILVWINTYNRIAELYKLLKDINNNKHLFKLKIFILDDCSNQDYPKMLREYGSKLDIFYHRMSFNHGKLLYWKLCNYALSQFYLERHQYKYFIKLDDDCRLVDNFFIKCVNIWEQINDVKKICLNFRLDSREGKAVWTGVAPRLYNFNKTSVYLSQWVDMDFFCELRMLQALGFRINEQSPLRWSRDKHRSSGVGQDISVRLNKSGYHLYLTTESLVQHDHHDSKMNPNERNINPLITKPFTNLNYGMLE